MRYQLDFKGSVEGLKRSSLRKITLVCCCLCRRCADTASLQRWVHKHGQQLRKLQLRCVRGLAELPCPQLLQLSLQSCDFDFTAGSSSLASSLSTATALTGLHLNKCTLLSSTTAEARAEAAHLLSAVAALTALQELSVCGVSCTASDSCPSVPVLLTTTVLQALQHLTQLQLQAEPQADALVQHIGSMTNLRDLRLGGVPEALLWHGGQRVTPLRLNVTQLTALTQLVRLGLRGVSLCRGGCTDAPAYGCNTCENQGDSATNAAALLTWLPSLEGLSSLQLRSVQGLFAGQEQHEALYPPAAAFKALTAGSGLKHIDLRGTLLTRNAWQRAFPFVRKFTSITSLRCDPKNTLWREDSIFRLQFALDSCPSLQALQIDLSYGSWQLLQQRPSLTRLTVSGSNGLSEPLALLGQLTQLKSLELLKLCSSTSWSSYTIHNTQLPDLAALTQLSFLVLEGDLNEECDAALWNSLAGAAQLLSATASSCKWALVNKVR